MVTMYANVSAVKPAACVTLFSSQYQGKFRNRRQSFGQGLEAPPVAIADVQGREVSDAEYRLHVEETTFTCAERDCAIHFAITLEEAREALDDYEGFMAGREAAIIAASDALKPIAWIDCERFTIAEHEYAESNRMTLRDARESLEAREFDRLATEYDGIDPQEADELRMSFPVAR